MDELKLDTLRNKEVKAIINSLLEETGPCFAACTRIMSIIKDKVHE